MTDFAEGVEDDARLVAAAPADAAGASWRVRCNRRHVCERACATCRTRADAAVIAATPTQPDHAQADELQLDVDLDGDEYWMADTDEVLLTRDPDEAQRWLGLGHDVRRVRVQIAPAGESVAGVAAPSPVSRESEAVASGQLGAWSDFISEVVFLTRATARGKGYAVAVHGSLFRDLDLVAVPWAEEACSAQELAEAICEMLVRCGLAFGWTADCTDGKGHEKPLGRMAWSISLSRHDGPRYLDLSIAPRAGAPR